MTTASSLHPSSSHPRPKTLGELRRVPDFDAGSLQRSVKDELRTNLLRAIERNDTLFPGVHGYDDTVVPQIVNALLSRHNFILLGLRGQAKSRILRGLVGLLDPEIPVVAGCEINDDPFHPICRACKDRLAADGDNTPINWMPRDLRYVEKLATPDVTIADIIGDVDPIRAARGGRDLSDELTIHYGLLPRANRGIFAINELPDLAGKIQVGLFNIMQEGDVQIKGYPLRLPLDVLLVFSANPKTIRRAGKSLRRSKTASARKFARTIRQPSKKEWPSRSRKRGHAAIRRFAWMFPIICGNSWKKLRSMRGTTSAWTSAPASASACPSPFSKASSAVPSSAPRGRARNLLSPASPICTRRFPPSPENLNSNTKAS